MASYQRIYDMLRAAGLTQEGALAMLGNWDCESNCESVRVQGDFNPYRTVSKQYVADVDSGRISRDQFKNDQKGFGLAQWTYFTRKAALYDFAKAKGRSIGDDSMQVEFALLELRSDFSGLLNNLKTSHDLYQCTNDICYKFENPAFKNVDARFQAANRIKTQIDLNPGPAPDPEPDPEPEPQPTPDVPTSEFWPPRTICKGMKGKDVEVLCAVLKARGWDVHYVTDDFGSFLEDAVIAFQKSAFPDQKSEWDGIVGPKTWAKLFDMSN